uniref:histone acetyltransferase n=2 Tax=Zea mays TaxID=4577 RepID=C0PP06_MAIZE|nr:unknown [Zea mays]
MMVLYHLHNPTAPAFVTTCNVCSHDIESGQGWRCEICPDFDVCNSCFQKGVVTHPHKLTNHPSTAVRDAQNAEARQMLLQQLRKMLDLLVHASTCTCSNERTTGRHCKRQGIPCNGQLGVLPLPPRRRPFRPLLQHQLTRRGLLRQPRRCLP